MMCNGSKVGIINSRFSIKPAVATSPYRPIRIINLPHHSAFRVCCHKVTGCRGYRDHHALRSYPSWGAWLHTPNQQHVRHLKCPSGVGFFDGETSDPERGERIPLVVIQLGERAPCNLEHWATCRLLMGLPRLIAVPPLRQGPMRGINGSIGIIEPLDTLPIKVSNDDPMLVGLMRVSSLDIHIIAESAPNHRRPEDCDVHSFSPATRVGHWWVRHTSPCFRALHLSQYLVGFMPQHSSTFGAIAARPLTPQYPSLAALALSPNCHSSSPPLTLFGGCPR